MKLIPLPNYKKLIVPSQRDFEVRREVTDHLGSHHIERSRQTLVIRRA